MRQVRCEQNLDKRIAYIGEGTVAETARNSNAKHVGSASPAEAMLSKVHAAEALWETVAEVTVDYNQLFAGR